MRTRIRLIVAAVVAALLAALLTVAPPTGGADRAEAAEAADFDPGFLVSDQQLYDGGAMSAAQVQAFIESKHRGCESGYTCLNRYRQSTVAIPADAYCGALAATSDESAASIIARVGAACDISQRFLLVLLEKEQSLVSHTKPTAIRYERATGFACPDTSPCNSAYGGFYYQVYFAARQFNRYAALPDNYRHQAGETNQVLFHPNAACGSSPVFIENLATAGLYNYTPYQPNAAALANLYGAGDACSAYGNRNTWRIWTDWFGDPTITLPTATRVSGPDRYATAVQVSRRTFATTAPVVYLASGQDFPDGLAAGPAAAHEGGPVLLTPQGSIPQAVLDEIRRLRPAKVVIVGAEPSVSAAVQTAVQALDPNREVVRLGGADRYETSRLIAEHAFDSAASAFVATGIRFPDALAAGPAAALRDGPVLLVDGRAAEADAATLATLQGLGVGWAGVVGDASSVSQGIASGLAAGGRTVQRYAGSDRYATAVQLSHLFSDVGSVYVASGTGFPDALAGAAAAGATGAPLLLTGPSCMPATTRSALIAFMPDEVLVLGGTPTISEASARYTSCG
ncbi:cell wall-binding repeat-containing protein [Agrococcus sediminis]|uniref:cell wall-binding repeat-containing protein n=1 Tax=Agrococcus sediminis TaxID=2599924 RepID=UPI0038086928